MKRLTTADFIKRAAAVHDGKFDYSKTVYHKGCAKVIITCPTHGDFEQFADNHLAGRGCKCCSGDRQRARMIELHRQRAIAKSVPTIPAKNEAPHDTRRR